MLLFLILSVVLLLCRAQHDQEQEQEQEQERDHCGASDANLRLLQCQLENSLGGGDPTCQVAAEGDWPNQAIYMNQILMALTAPTTCLDTNIAKNTVTWLDITDPSDSMWWWTWEVFQVQYYSMPRVSGDRVESPATLGRKCWAFAYLAQIWPDLYPALHSAMTSAGYDLTAFYREWVKALELTMPLCDEVMANCFINASYDPSLRNGTCPGSVHEFYVGFQWENGNNNFQWRNDSVLYPFPTYNQTKKFQSDVTFAVNTALNYII